MKWKTTYPARVMPVALMSMLLAAGQAHADDTPQKKRENDLLQELAKSDAQAAALQQRIEQLESRVHALRSALSTAEPSPPAPRMIPVAVLRPGAMLAQASPPSAPENKAPSSGSSAARSAPGAFEVDEEAAQRALERTLTQSGALLLPQRTIEITPSYAYRRNERTIAAPTTLTSAATGASSLVLVNHRIRQNENTLRLAVRAGLPYSTQLEFGLPYNNVRTSQVSDLGSSSSEDGNGIGDTTLGIAKTLTREKGWIPDMIGRATYNFGNGKKHDGNVNLNGGYRQFTAELVALKRQDPLAFTASAFYSKSFEDEGIRPGDAIGVSLSALLAASPATSLQFGFSQIHRQEQERNGVNLSGSDQTYGIATLGATSVLSRDMTLVTQLGIGLGNDAPKYNISIALPILLR